MAPRRKTIGLNRKITDVFPSLRGGEFVVKGVNMRSDAREAAFKIVYAGLFHECEKSFHAETYRKANSRKRSATLLSGLWRL